MKKIITVTSLLFCALLLCTACSKNMSFVKFNESLKDLEDKNVTFTSANEIEEISGYGFLSNLDEMLVLEDNKGNTVFYNAKEEKTVLSISTKKLISRKIFKVRDSFFIGVVEETASNNSRYTTTIYDGEGASVISESGNITLSDSKNLSYSFDIFAFCNSVFRVDENGKASLISYNPLTGKLPSFDYKTENYYYVIDESVTVYDSALNEVYFWQMPFTTYKIVNYFLLGSDNVLAQYIEELPDDATDYTFIGEENIKYKLTSTILNVKRGTEKQVDLSYVVALSLFHRDSAEYSSGMIEELDESLKDYDLRDCFHKDIDTLAYVISIEDKKLLDTTSGFKLVSLDSNGKIDYLIAGEYDSLPILYTEGKYIYSTHAGNTYIIDAKGNKLNKFDSSLVSTEKMSNYYIHYDGKIYDHDLNLKYDLNKEGMTFVKMLANSVLLRDANHTYYVYTPSGELVEISDVRYNVHTSTPQIVVLYGNGYKYIVVNELGTKLTTTSSSSSLTWIYGDGNDDFNLYMVSRDNTKTYYKAEK
ncbi:MAG: hypothetical protein J6Q68_04135 [Clostridia bacterium]|nr:hypothetical protein [Clostridia bacterium]